MEAQLGKHGSCSRLLVTGNISAALAAAATTTVVLFTLLSDVIHDEVVQVLQASLAQAGVDGGAGADVDGAGIDHARLPVPLATAGVDTLCPRNMGLLSVVTVLSEAAVWDRFSGSCSSYPSLAWRKNLCWDHQSSAGVAGGAQIHPPKAPEGACAFGAAELSNTPHFVIRDRVIFLLAQVTARYPLPLGYPTPPVLVTGLAGKLVQDRGGEVALGIIKHSLVLLSERQDPQTLSQLLDIIIVFRLSATSGLLCRRDLRFPVLSCESLHHILDCLIRL